MTEQWKGLIVVGAGSFGREVAAYAEDAGLNVLGLADDDPTALRGFDLGLPLLCPIEAARSEESAGFVVAVGEPETRRELANRLKAVGAVLVNVVHPTAYVAKTAQLGRGCILSPYSLVATNATVGDNTALNLYASVGHDAVVGPDCVFSPYSVINGRVELHAGVFLGTHATVTPGKRVGTGTKVAAGAVVTRDVGEGFLMVGNPAKGRALFRTGRMT